MPSGQPWGWRFIDLAALGTNSVRSYVVTLLSVILLPLAVLALAVAALLVVGLGYLLPGAAEPTAAIAIGIALVIGTGLTLAWRVTRSHRRPWMSLISSDLRLDWRRLAIGAGVEGMLFALTIWLGHLVANQPWPSGSGMTLPGLAMVMLLVPFQAASEEILFRGYLTQALGRLMRHRAMIAVSVGVVFGAIHLNAYGPLTIPYLLVLSLIFSLVSLRDERLELVIGAHTANNWLAIGAFDVVGAVGRGAQLRWTAIAILIAHGAAFYYLTRLLVRVFCKPRSLV
jgi:uncharacterized protein